MDINAIEEAIDELVAFNFPEFTPHFLQGMKKEAAAYKAMVDATKGLEGTNNCFWKTVPGAADYDRSLEAKIAKDPTKYQNMTWEDDPIEVPRRRWEWWRSKRGKFTYFSKAARLVVLVQVSSAAVERIFSQVKYILEQIGDSALEENIETRMMERVNNQTMMSVDRSGENEVKNGLSTSYFKLN